MSCEVLVRNQLNFRMWRCVQHAQHTITPKWGKLMLLFLDGPFYLDVYYRNILFHLNIWYQLGVWWMIPPNSSLKVKPSME